MNKRLTRRSLLVAALGMSIPFLRHLPDALLPVALAETDDGFWILGKDGLRILNDRPINAETPAHLLDDPVTPARRLFVRNNGVPPYTDDIEPLDWVLDVEGESCLRPATLTLRELQARFKHYTYQLQIECGGNGRSEFNPPARGNQWTTGAVGCPEVDRHPFARSARRRRRCR